jgi:hypothetical protein
MMTHTYLNNGSVWKAEGTYYDEANHAFPVTGETHAVHTDKEWSLDGYMEVGFDVPVRFFNRYSITETDSSTTLAWESYNPALGKLCGSFEMLGSKIISFYTSDGGKFSGTEMLIQISPSIYEAAGVSYCDGKKMSSWDVRLTAV